MAFIVITSNMQVHQPDLSTRMNPEHCPGATTTQKQPIFTLFQYLQHTTFQCAIVLIHFEHKNEIPQNDAMKFFMCK